uniref:limulus clotting factor C n=1 Tax=Strigamia maritima TaxID=126957 RepID=T1JHR6_STRMM
MPYKTGNEKVSFRSVYMTGFQLSLFLLLSLTPSFDAGPVDLGLCQPRLLACQCGQGNSYPIYMQIPQCTKFYRWKPNCADCKDVPSDSELCAVFSNCLDCEPDIKQCLRCPAGRYGTWCTGVCSVCANGGICNRDTGRCDCPEGFTGIQCEETKGCLAPHSHIIGGEVIDWTQQYLPGAAVTYKCNEGFEMQGIPTLYCLENGFWNLHPPTCIPSAISTSPPTIDCERQNEDILHGSVNHDPQSKMLTYSCINGYELIGDALRICAPDGNWTGTEPECVKIITCDLPPIPASTHFTVSTQSRTNLAIGTRVDLSCQPDFVLLGDDSIVCRVDGTWSASPPNCVHQDHTCTHPGNFVNGEIRVAGDRSSSAFIIGATIHFTCHPLNYLSGDSSITCNINNTWSGTVPTCIKVITCPPIETIHSGHVNIFAPSTDSSSTFQVSGNSSVTSRIGFVPRFRGGLPTQSTRALTVQLPKGHHHIGTRASFSCISRYYDLVGSKLRSCMPTGEWSGRPAACIPECGRSSGPRIPLITHGTPSVMGQWPWQVGIARRLEEDNPLGDWFIMCGGSVISESLVLTAAHCVTHSGTNVMVPNDEFRLYFGKYFRNDSRDDEQVQVRSVSEIHVHPDFEPSTFESDIALIRVEPEITFTSRVQPVCLPSENDGDDRLAEGRQGTVIGWGMKEDSTYSDILQHVQVPVVPGQQCQKDYRKIGVPIVVSSNMICAGNETGGFDSCNGDSGGPFVFPTHSQSDRWVLEGIVSWGSPFGCGNERQYGGYARVRRFTNWIEHFI